MISVKQTKKVDTEIFLSHAESKEVIHQYVSDVIIGTDCYITTEGTVEHWTSYPHGSGTTTKKGEATNFQKLASAFLKELKAQDANRT